ncbi:MAG: DUF4157 domain-containing protein, partial [Thermoanaerobaculales bacterium]|nr:DUF4157 domain-containing protein [Thermoanaerobaculales bacterium]
YDGRGFLTQECHPELGQDALGENECITYTEYDALGNVLKKTDGGRNYEYLYDCANRLIQVKADGDILRTYTYCDDPATQGCPAESIGKLDTVVANNWYAPDDPVGPLVVVETFTYGGDQARGGLISQKQTTVPLPNPANPTTFTQEFTWDDLGNLIKETYPIVTILDLDDPIGIPNRTIENTFSWGRLTKVQESEDEVEFTDVISFMSYHGNGMLNQVTHENDVTETFGLDDHSMQRPSSITVRDATNTDLWMTGAISYDGVGNITEMGSDWFSYDGMSRLMQAHLDDVDNDDVADTADFSYRYDIFGNRRDMYWSELDESGRPITNWYAAKVDAETNRLSAEGYDDSGNMTSLHGDTFTWYPENRLRRRTGTGRNYLYGYTADGERLMTWVNAFDPTGHFTFTLRDLDGRVVREFRLSGETYTWVKDWVHAGGKVVATVDGVAENKQTQYQHLDHLGTPRVITDGAGALVSYNAYSPYGIQLTGEKSERLKFTGHERDVGNLDYLHARFYSPMVAWFVSMDPVGGTVGRSGSFNRYSYVLNNPLKFVDPDGKEEIEANLLQFYGAIYSHFPFWKPSMARVQGGSLGERVTSLASRKGLPVGGITIGNQIFLDASEYGEYRRKSRNGIALVGHELAHTAQWLYQNQNFLSSYLGEYAWNRTVKGMSDFRAYRNTSHEIQGYRFGRLIGHVLGSNPAILKKLQLGMPLTDEDLEAIGVTVEEFVRKTPADEEESE